MTKSATRRSKTSAVSEKSSEPCYRVRVDSIAPGAPVIRQPLKRSVVVAMSIIREITEQQLKPGDQLPLESEMLTHYKVSRSSLREALRLLEAQGLISIRTGPRGGTTVGRPLPFYLARTAVPYLHMAGATYGQALETWAMTETLLARAAALNPDREAVEAALRPFTEGQPPLARRGMNVGVSFHDLIALLTGNPVLDLMMRSVAHIVTDYIVNAMPVPLTLSAWMEQDHAELARAIIAGDADQAADIMTRHSRRVIEEFSRFAPHQIGEQIHWD